MLIIKIELILFLIFLIVMTMLEWRQLSYYRKLVSIINYDDHFKEIVSWEGRKQYDKDGEFMPYDWSKTK